MLVTLERALSLPSELIGGKAKNLARLQSFGFPTPPSWVLPANLYRDILENSPIASQLEHDHPLDTEDLIPFLRATPLPAKLKKQLESLEISLAVRSSATCEDGQDASFAGVHESYLHIRGVQELWSAIKSCYASLWTPRAQAYRQQMGFPHDQVQCAVLLCTMVKAESAGVAFTCDPLSGQRDCVTINAGTYGENVVSGESTPQRIYLSFQKGRLDVVDPGTPCYLNSSEALRLARSCIRIHWAMGRGEGAQDIEWAHDGRRFVFLQARPVTNLRRATYPALSNQPVIWSNANLKDILPGIQLTLDWNLTQGSIRSIGLASIAEVGGDIPPGMEFSKRFFGRAYLDMTALQWALYDTFALPPERTVRDLGGQAPSLRLPSGVLSSKAPRRALNGLRLLWKVFSLSWRLPKAVKRLENFSQEALSWDLGGLNPDQLLERLYEVRDALFQFSRLYQFVNIRASIMTRLLQTVFRLFAPRLSTTLLVQALSGEDDIVSARQGQDLVHLTNLAEKESEVRRWLEKEHRNPQAWKTLSKESEFKLAFERYLQEFGHRSVYELRLENPRWGEDPSYILDQIAMMMDSEHTQRIDVEENHWLVQTLRPLNKLARHALVTRERAKSALVWSLYPTRRIFLEIAEQLHRRDILRSPNDIFHLCWMDLECYLLGEWDGKGSFHLVESRKKDIELWRETKTLPDFFILDQKGRPTDWSPSEILHRRPEASGSQLKGIGVSAGMARGKARILTDPSEGMRFHSGEILIAPSTDPGWTPLFARAAAVVMEVGGELSHGAIVAREFGLPAVVGIPQLLERLEDGQEIIVDGDRGIVIQI